MPNRRRAMSHDLANAAVRPHERLLFNVAVVHFLLPAILFATKNLWIIVGAPVLVSLLVISTIAGRVSRPQEESELIRAHWELAWRRSRYLLLAYLVALVVFVLAWLLLSLQADTGMRAIRLAVAGWFSLLPVSLTLVLLLVL